MVADSMVSLRGLKADAKVFDEMIFDVNTDYFQKNSGYEFAKRFYNIIPAVQLFSKMIGLFVSISVFAIAFIFGSPLVGIFAETGTPVYEIERNGFLVFPVSFLFCGLNIFASATFTALSNGKLSAILSFLRTFGLITVLFLTLPNVLGVTGVWLAVPRGELITMIVALVFLHQNSFGK